MRDTKHHIYLDKEEKALAIHSLNEFRNLLIQQGRYTDVVDELLFKIMKSKPKRIKVKYSPNIN
ncbi:MAG: hypothetical protein RR355_03590 [Oscillospiraceae bacterium]